ncbi:MAG: hypothetical protein RSD80_04310 [Raoultibacter sp.]
MLAFLVAGACVCAGFLPATAYADRPPEGWDKGESAPATTPSADAVPAPESPAASGSAVEGAGVSPAEAQAAARVAATGEVVEFANKSAAHAAEQSGVAQAAELDNSAKSDEQQASQQHKHLGPWIALTDTQAVTRLESEMKMRSLQAVLPGFAMLGTAALCGVAAAFCLRRRPVRPPR